MLFSFDFWGEVGNAQDYLIIKLNWKLFHQTQLKIVYDQMYYIWICFTILFSEIALTNSIRIYSNSMWFLSD